MPIPDFFDCLMAEGLETARQMAAIAESHAMVMAQHLATLEKTIEAARGYRGEQKKLAVALAELANPRAEEFPPERLVRNLKQFRSDFGEGKDIIERAKVAREAAMAVIEETDRLLGLPEAAAGSPIAGDKTLRQKILDRYAATGDDYEVMAFQHGLMPGSVNQWLRDARDAGDPRAAAGDLLKLTREEAEEANLRTEFRLEGTSKHGILFPLDEEVGNNLAVLNIATGDVRTEEGVANVPPYWIKAIECLNDQREVPGPELIKAGAFPSELALLRELRSINEKLAEAKLYILADSTHYQLCRLL